MHTLGADLDSWQQRHIRRRHLKNRYAFESLLLQHTTALRTLTGTLPPVHTQVSMLLYACVVVGAGASFVLAIHGSSFYFFWECGR